MTYWDVGPRLQHSPIHCHSSDHVLLLVEGLIHETRREVVPGRLPYGRQVSSKYDSLMVQRWV